MKPIGLFVLALVAACQSGQQGNAPSTNTAGTTTHTTGTPVVTRSDTTVISGTAQDSSRGEVTLTLDRAAYTAGATATMTVKSSSRDTLGYNQCSSRSLERQQGSSWVRHPEPDRMCTMELRLLMPGETQTARADIPAGLAAGTYRMVLTLSRQRQARPGESAAPVRAVSAAFRVG